jgi:hypothetical protein
MSSEFIPLQLKLRKCHFLSVTDVMSSVMGLVRLTMFISRQPQYQMFKYHLQMYGDVWKSGV